jgi:transcriptional regulator GlxA family with amidase domain
VHTVVALALPGVVAFDLSIPSMVFGHPAESHWYEFEVCGVEPGLVETASGFGVHVPRGLESLARADTIIVPGYAPADPPDAAVLDALRAAAAVGTRLVSVCTGAFALAAAGVLDGRRATTHWQDTDELAAQYPNVIVEPDVLFIGEGPVLTSAGVAAGIDLCLHIVRMDHGEEAASTIARRMVMAPHREGGQAQFLQRPIPAVGTGLAATSTWALQRLQEQLTVADMARHAGHAPRTFARRFLAETGATPLQWLSAQRVLEARRLLETTDLPIDQVAVHSGLGSAANLRLHLTRDAGVSPTSYRRAYRGPTGQGAVRA